jgi:hypothetical protein
MFQLETCGGAARLKNSSRGRERKFFKSVRTLSKIILANTSVEEIR